MQTEAERTPYGIGAAYDRVFYTLNSKVYYSAAFGFVQEQFHTNGRGVSEQRLFSRERGVDGKHICIAEKKDLSAGLPTAPVAHVATHVDFLGASETGLMCNGKREGMWARTEKRKLDGYTYTTEMPYVAGMRQGMVTGRYPDGTVSFQVPYVNDKENGVRMFYHPNGALHGRMEVKDNRPCGARRFWHNNGKPSLRCWHNEQGEMEGPSLSWAYYGQSLHTSVYNGKGRQIGMSYTYDVTRTEEGNKLTLTHQYDHGDGTPGKGEWVVLPERHPPEKADKPHRGDRSWFRQLGSMVRELTHRKGGDKAAVTPAPKEKAQTLDGPQ